MQNAVNTSTRITKTHHTIVRTPPHTHTNTLQNKLKQPKYNIPNEIVTIQSSTLSISSPKCTWYFCPQELHRNSLHFKTRSLHINHVSSLHHLQGALILRLLKLNSVKLIKTAQNSGSWCDKICAIPFRPAHQKHQNRKFGSTYAATTTFYQQHRL